MKKILSLFGLLLLPISAFAHEVMVGGFQAGIKHPVLGLDHLLAMVSVGVISAQMGGRSIWTVPATFVVVMVLGGVLGMMNVGLIAIETGIALSVVVLGLAIANNAKMHCFFTYGFVSLFAIFHGYAHGLEMPELAISWAYVGGFMTGTAALHILGVLIRTFSKKIRDGETILRYTGAFVAGMGLHILIG